MLQRFIVILITIHASCSPPTSRAPVLIPARDVPKSTKPPVIQSILDLGNPKLNESTPLSTMGSDGIAVIGEAVLISGQHFGKYARVTVDGQTADHLARTDSGGIIIRIPWGVRPGKRQIEVINVYGRNASPFSIRRYALATIPSRDKVYIFEVHSGKIQRVAKPLSIPNAQLVRYGGGGQIAYVSGRDAEGKLNISIVDMTAAGGPKIIRAHQIQGHQLIALTAAEQVPLALAISDTHLHYFDLRNSQTVNPYRAYPLPQDIHDDLVTGELNPDGTLLATLLRKNNRVILFDMSDTDVLKPLAGTQVLPQKNSSLLRDLSFSPDSSTLWVVSGDNSESISQGKSPLRLSAIQIQIKRHANLKSYGILSVWRTLDVPYQAAPVSLAVARGQPLANGPAVHIPPQNAAVFITVHDSKLLKLAGLRLDQQRGLKRAVDILRGIEPLGTLIKTDIDGHGGPMFNSRSLLGSLDITSDAQLLLIMGAQVEVQRQPAQVKLVYGITSSRVFGKPHTQFLPLDDVDPDNLARPFLMGDVRIQP